MYKESKNTIVKHLVNKLRDINTNPNEFRRTIKEIAKIMLSEALHSTSTCNKNIMTWQGSLDIDVIDESKLVIVPILRAGEPMLDGLLETLPNTTAGFFAMKRDEQTAQSKIYYNRIPPLENKTVLIVDPMLATGGSLIGAIDFLKSLNPKKIISINIIGSPEGIKNVINVHPDVNIFIAQVDKKLNKDSYIIPGIGDAGDRAFNTL